MLIEARTRAALTQAELAERMETTQIGCSPSGERPYPSVHTDTGKDRARHGHQASDQFRSRMMRP